MGRAVNMRAARSHSRREDPRLVDLGELIPNKPRSRRRNGNVACSDKPKKQKKPAKSKQAVFVAPPYAEYMASKAWRKKRVEAFRYFGKMCCRCKSTRKLHVHHKSYASFGRERMRHLEILCEDCHALEHEAQHPFRCDSLSREFREIVG